MIGNLRHRGKSHLVLSYQQVERLQDVIETELEVHGRGNFPPLQLCVRELIQAVLRRTKQNGLCVKHVKINGGAASHILSSWQPAFNDIDLIFDVELSNACNFEIVREAVLDSLMDLLPPDTSTSKLRHATLQDAYVRKMVKVADGYDRWSLISLNNNFGRFIELKFVDRMRRQFEFSVDSFQISLDHLLAFYDTGVVVLEDESRRRRYASSFSTGSVGSSCFSAASSVNLDAESDRLSVCSLSGSVVALDVAEDASLAAAADNKTSNGSSSASPRTSPPNSPSASLSDGGTACVRICPTFYPCVVAESVYGNIDTALAHLNEKRIDTRYPEEIRGGGLLKYCSLLVRGFRAAIPRKLSQMERYMCSRFFIDFPDIEQQTHKLNSYLENHFYGDLCSKYEYLLLLGRIINDSTVCLMSQERTFTLQMIYNMACQTYAELQQEQQQQQSPSPAALGETIYLNKNWPTSITSYSNTGSSSFSKPSTPLLPFFSSSSASLSSSFFCSCAGCLAVAALPPMACVSPVGSLYPSSPSSFSSSNSSCGSYWRNNSGY